MSARRVASKMASLGLLGAAVATAAPAAAQELTEANWRATRDRVLPSAEELAWTAIPWHTTLAAAALEADAQGRPILLWTMDGHPFGGT